MSKTLNPVRGFTVGSALVLAVICMPMQRAAYASDVTWTNGSANFQWDTSSLNWNTGAWNNANGDGAIFNATGAGSLSLMGPINVNSLNFTVDGYALNGVGPLNIVNGSSTQTTGVVNVTTGTAKVNVPINSSLGFQKIGNGILELSASNSFSGGIGLDGRNTLVADLLVGGAGGLIPSGTLRVTSGSVIPASTRVSLSDGFLDIGNNNVTVSQLIFPNQNDFVVWNPAINAAGCGVIGTGTLRVLGDINVIGVSGGNSGSNTIAANLDLGGGTQVVRTAQQGSAGLYSSLQFSGTLSNGSLLKAYGTSFNGVQAQADGIALYGNNTYTGSTRLNGGFNVVTGTNATTSVEVAGSSTGGSVISLQGANGSLQSATTIQAVAGSALVLDNNAALGSGQFNPAIPAAQNNNRIRDDAEVQLRDGSFTYRGLSTAAATETFGKLNVTGGFNTVTLAPTGTGGTATLTASGDLSLAPRSTLLVSTATIGAASK
ncbi:MAG TPA: hypothetical protein VMV81_05080, partial [Phycisphaerae bacterium]|nr:hypothetical protein [Phycisphaerae bacterium]